MDNMVNHNDENMLAEGVVDITPYASELKSGSFEGSTGAPEAAKPGQFRMKLYWKQMSIDGTTSKTKVIANMYFYHKWDWYSSVHGQNNNNNNTYIIINGNKRILPASVDVGGLGGEYFVMSHEVEIAGTVSSITLTGRCDIGQSFDQPIWYGVEGSQSISLIIPIVPPNAPTSAVLSGRFENGNSTSIAWSGASGTITGYDIERRFWVMSTSGGTYSNWTGVVTNQSGSSYGIGHVAITHHAQQCRVRSVNSAGASAWKESNWVYHYGTTVYTTAGGTPLDAIVRVWNGSAWINETYLMVWDGSNWVVGK